MNTGPIHMLSVDLTDPTTDPADEITLHTEAVWNMRTAPDGRLLVSYADPQGSLDPANGALAIKDTEGAWTVITSITDHPPVHDFSALVRDNGDLVVVGAADTPAAAWISTDNGTTWTYEPITDTPDGDPSQGYVRAWTVIELDGILHAWVDDGSLTVTDWNGHFIRRDDEGTWTKVDDDVRAKGSTKVTVDGTVRALLLTSGPDSGGAVNGGSLRSMDGALSTWEANGVYALNAAADGSLWWLTNEPALYRGATDGSHRKIAGLDDATVRCLAVDTARGYVYLGTTDSRVLRVPIPDWEGA